MKTQALLIAMLLLVPAALRAQDLATASSETVTEGAQNTQPTLGQTNSNNAPQASQSTPTPAQQSAQPASQPPANSTIDKTIDASESDGDLERNHLIPR